MLEVQGFSKSNKFNLRIINCSQSKGQKVGAKNTASEKRGEVGNQNKILMTKTIYTLQNFFNYAIQILTKYHPKKISTINI